MQYVQYRKDKNMRTIIKKNILTSIVISILTMGLYAIYWEYLTVKNIRAMKKDDAYLIEEYLCVMFVPFYSIYWWYTRGRYATAELTARGYAVTGNETVYLVLAIFGLNIVSLAILQKNLNALPPDAFTSDSAHTNGGNNGFCDVCGAKLAPDSAFCEICGNPVQKTAPDTDTAQLRQQNGIVCAVCGAKVPADSKFCEICGEPIGETAN